MNWDTLDELKRFFRLVKVDVKFRRISGQDKVKVYGDVNNELVKPYLDGTMRVMDGGDFIEVVA